MADVLLINPSFNPDRSKPTIKEEPDISTATLPLALVHLGAYLEENGFKIKCVDTRLYSSKESLQKISECLNDVHLVGLSVMTTTIPDALRISDFVKSHDKHINVVWGGAHPTLFPEQTVNDSSVDFAVVGEGEIPLQKLANHLRHGKPEIADVPNLYYKRGGEIIANAKIDFLDVNELPFPDYDLLEIKKYITRIDYEGERVRVLELQTSRGCPHRCTFCINTIVNKQIWRAQTPNKILENVDRLIDRYDLDHIVFLDENFFSSKKRVEAILRELTNYDVKWIADCRADYFSQSYINDDFLSLMKKSGCGGLFIGIESGSRRMLDILKKDITIQEAINAVRHCALYDIRPLVSVMLGIPGETKEDLLKTLRLMWFLKKENPKLLWSGPQLFRPYPGGELYKLCVQSGFVEPKTLRGWANQLIQQSFASYIDVFSWIKDDETIDLALDLFVYMNILNFVERPAPLSAKRAFINVPMKALSEVIKLRWSRNFWKAPVEARTLRGLARVLNLRNAYNL